MFGRGKAPEGLELNREAIDILEKLVRDNTGEPSYRLLLASTYGNRSYRLSRVGQIQAAIESERRAVDLQEELVRDFPSRPMYQQLLIGYLYGLGEYLSLYGQPRESIPVGERAVKVGEALVGKFANVPDYQEELGRAHGMLAYSRVMIGDLEGAEASFRRALAVFKKLVADDPDRGAARERLGAMYSNLVELLTLPGRPKVDPSDVVRLAEEAVTRCPKHYYAWRALGQARYHAGDWKGALLALEQARTIDDAEDGFLWLLLALSHGRLGDRAQARKWYDKAVTWVQQHPHQADPSHLLDEAAALLGVTEPADDQTQEKTRPMPQ